jgi:hypothetical protein
MAIKREDFKQGAFCFFPPFTKNPNSKDLKSVKELWYPIKIEMEDEPRKIKITHDDSVNSEGKCIVREDRKSTIAILDNEGYIATDQLTGCVFELYKTHDNKFLGAHIFKGGGSVEHTGMETFAREKKLQRICRWESADKGGNCCSVVHVEKGVAQWGVGLRRDNQTGRITEVEDLEFTPK